MLVENRILAIQYDIRTIDCMEILAKYVGVQFGQKYRDLYFGNSTHSKKQKAVAEQKTFEEIDDEIDGFFARAKEKGFSLKKTN